MDTSDAGRRRRRRHSAECKAAVMAARRHSGRKCRRARLRPTAKATDYSLTRWTALTRNVGDGNLPAGSNWIENRIRPIALGRANWLFAGSLRAGLRAAAIMSLIGSAKMNDLDPYVYLKDVLERLPTHPARRIEELLPHRWRATPPH